MSWKLEYTVQENGETFYRYRENDTIIWFNQDDENGNAFYCYVRNEDKTLKYIDFYTKGKTYPTQVYFTYYSGTIVSQKDYAKVSIILAKAEAVRESVAKFLTTGKHYKLWRKNNDKTRTN